MLPRLQAEEDMRAYNVLLAAGGRMRKHDEAAYRQTLERAVRQGERPRRPDSLDELAALGIGVRRKKVKARG